MAAGHYKALGSLSLFDFLPLSAREKRFSLARLCFHLMSREKPKDLGSMLASTKKQLHIFV
jgi:hypothetical protein